MTGRLFEFQVGEVDGLVTIDHAADLASGQTIASCADTVPAGITQSGSTSVSGSQTTRKLNTPTAGLYVVPYALTLANPAGTFPDYYVVRVTDVPEAS